MNTYTMSDRTPYTYVITHLPSGIRYYGSRYAKHCKPDDLWITYFTSSNKIKKLLEKDGVNSFKAEVRRTFSTVEECRHWEAKFLERINAQLNENWFNKHNGGSTFYNVSPASKLTKQRMSKARLGVPKSESMKRNSLRNFKLTFPNGTIEYIRGSQAVLERLGRTDWETIRICITHKNGYLPRDDVYVERVPKSEGH